MTDVQEPSNRLEHQLAEAQRGEVPLRTFLDTLVRSEVYILLHQEPGDEPRREDLDPLVVHGGADQLMLAIFTSEHRALHTDAEVHEHRYPYRVNMGSLLKGLQRGVGAVVNPGWKLGFEVQPQDVRHMIDELNID